MAGHHAMEEAEPVILGQTRVTAVRVDHSIPGSCGYLIETSDGKTIAITGDFRLHGTNERRALTEHFIDVVREREVDLLVVEGTNIDEYSALHEEVVDEGWSIKASIRHEVELAFERGGMVIVGVSGNNIERIDSIYEVVRELGALPVGLQRLGAGTR